MHQRLISIFEILLEAFGKRNWWPGETKLEIIVGAILTQNTSWKNVERAICNMKAHGIMDVAALQSIGNSELGEIIKSSGFYRQKADKLKRFVNVLHQIFNGNIDNCEYYSTEDLRNLMLGIHGIGRETADSILLYALNRPVFVADTYTGRFLKNHKLHDGFQTYDSIQQFFMGNLPPDTYLFNEFHALIVCLGQRYCKKKPHCDICPLVDEQTRSSAVILR